MEMQLYIIYDLKAQAPASKVIQMLHSDPEAQRMFTSVIQSENNLIAQHPEDFSLLNIGSFNVLTLQLTPNLSTLHQPVSTGAYIVRELRARMSPSPTHDSQMSIPGT